MEKKIKGLLLAKTSFSKGTGNKFNATTFIRLVMKKMIVGTKESHNALNAKYMGIWQGIVNSKLMKKSWHN